MSDTLYILATVAQDKLAIIFAGDELYNGPNISGQVLNNILQSVIGSIDDIKYHVVTESQMDYPVNVIYGD